MTDPEWRRSLILVLTPDAFLRGLGAALLGDVEAAGFSARVSRIVQPGAIALDALYEDVVAHNGSWRTYRYRCVDELFGLGTSLAVLMVADGARAPADPHAFMQGFKGSGPLHEADPGCLRRRYGSVNSILSLLHTSASPAEAALDYTIFFRRDWLTGDGDVLPARPSALPELDARLAARLLDAPEGQREERDFRRVRSQFRGRVVIHLWELCAGSAHRRIAQSHAAYGMSAFEDPELLRACVEGLGHRVDPIVTRGLTHPFTPEAEPLDTRRLWQALAGIGISVDPWERAVLATSQYFDPIR